MPRVHPDSLLASFRSPTYLRWQAGVQTLWLVGLIQGALVTHGYRLELAPATEAELALVLREAVTHIHRHSRATEARVVITRNGEAFSMRITDNGCGGLAAHGNGVSGMRERISRVGGRLAIASPSRQGTTLTIDVAAARGMLEHTA
jgi:two-component system sensor histidine kinase DesK